MPIQVIRSARANYPIESYIADKGQIFYDEDTGELRLSNGTPGGLRILSGQGDVQGYLNSVQGDIVPDQDNLRDLGSPEKQWRDLYLSGSSLVINGVRISVENDQLVLPENTIIQNQQVSNFSGDYNDLTNRPDLSLFQLTADAFNGDYDQLTNKPDLAAYQLTANAFSGDYVDLVNKPTIPTNTNQLTNGAGFITLGNLTGYATRAFVTSQGYLTAVDWNTIQNKPNIPDALSVGLIDSQNNLGNLSSNISILRFDSDSGFDVTDLGNGAVKIAMNSTFKTWKVDGQDDLIATGLDTIEFEAGTGITITTNPAASPNKKITFTALGGDYNNLVNLPDLSVYQLSADAFTGDYANLDNKPDLSVYQLSANAFTGDYPDLTNKPDLSVYQLSANAFSGNYEDLTNKPPIPDLQGYATETFVNNAVSALVDSAPEALDTLTELAAALGNDENFATSISTAIGAKANTADLAAVATSGDYADLINKPTIPTNNNQLANGSGYITAGSLSQYATQSFVTTRGYLTSVSYDIITGKPNFSTVATTGSYNDLINLPTLFTGNYNDLTNKPSIPDDTADLTNSAGFITNTALQGYATENYVDNAISAVVGSAPEVLDTLKELSDALGGDEDFATNVAASISAKANSVDLSSVAFSGDYADLSNKPLVPRDLSELTDNQNLLASEYSFNIAADDSTQREINNRETVKFLGTNGVTTSSDAEGNITVSGPSLAAVAASGSYLDLNDKPTIPQNLNDLGDVDVATNPPQFGQVLKYDGEKWGPAADQGSIDPNTGGVVTDASTLNGFSGTYYLNYNNLNNKPDPYELPPATAETLGGVKIGENINVNNGVISVPKGAGINKVVDIPDVYDDNGLENKYILRYNSGATRWETEDLDLSNSTMDGGFY